MGTLNPDILSEELTGALSEAATIMRGLRQRVLTPEHLLLAFLDNESYVAHTLLARFADERGFKLSKLTQAVEGQARTRRAANVDFDFVAQDGARVSLGDEMLEILDEGLSIAQARGEIWTGTEDALAAMCQTGVSTAGLLQKRGITPTAMSSFLSDTALSRQSTTRDLVAQAREGELRPVYYRQDLLRDLLNLLNLARDRHVILVGPAGVGKRSLVQSLALLIAEGKGPRAVKSVVAIAEPALLANAERAIQAGRRKASGGVLFLPNVHRFFGGVLQAEFHKAQSDVQRAFLDDRAVVIGTTSDVDYQARLATNTSLAEHSHVLKVPEPGHDETVEILRVHKPHAEADYEITISDEALGVATTLAKRYLSDVLLPASALQLLHRACALLRMGAQPHLAFRPPTTSETQLDAEDVTLAASLMTGVPVANLGADERGRYAHMVEHLHKRIIGQDEAVLAVSRAVKTARVGLKDPRRPIGSFLFLGPTGVGKTELAKALAEFLFGDEEATVALDMSEYQQEHTVNRLIGAPPGYIGYESGGQLTDAVRDRSYTVVLFDEVEKAHPRVLDILLQVMEEGRLTDGQGRTASFSEAVIIMTSNLGSEYLTEPVLTDATREQVMQLVKATLRPEFLNRLDEIILFHPLSQEQLRLILGLMLKKETKLLAARGVSLQVSEDARTWMLAQNDHPEWGARPLRRYLREPLADYLLAADPGPGAMVQVDAGEQGLTFEAT